MEEVEARNKQQYYNDLLKTPFYPSQRWIAVKKVNGEIDVVIDDTYNNEYMTPPYTDECECECECECEGEGKGNGEGEGEGGGEVLSKSPLYFASSPQLYASGITRHRDAYNASIMLVDEIDGILDDILEQPRVKRTKQLLIC